MKRKNNGQTGGAESPNVSALLSTLRILPDADEAAAALLRALMKQPNVREAVRKHKLKLPRSGRTAPAPADNPASPVDFYEVRLLLAMLAKLPDPNASAKRIVSAMLAIPEFSQHFEGETFVVARRAGEVRR